MDAQKSADIDISPRGVVYDLRTLNVTTMSEASMGYRYTSWRQVTRGNGTSAGQTRQRGKNIEYRNTGAQGGTYGGYMQTLAARTRANNVTQRVNSRLNRR